MRKQAEGTAVADSLWVAALLWHRQAEAGLSLTPLATCMSMFLREACGMRGAKGGLQLESRTMEGPSRQTHSGSHTCLRNDPPF